MYNGKTLSPANVTHLLYQLMSKRTKIVPCAIRVGEGPIVGAVNPAAAGLQWCPEVLIDIGKHGLAKIGISLPKWAKMHALKHQLRQKSQGKADIEGEILQERQSTTADPSARRRCYIWYYVGNHLAIAGNETAQTFQLEGLGSLNLQVCIDEGLTSLTPPQVLENVQTPRDCVAIHLAVRWPDVEGWDESHF